MKIRSLVLLLVVGFCSTIMLLGQEFTGRVSDTSGAAVVQASILVHNTLTNEDIQTQTNQAGVYTVPYLKPGQYSVTASATGFATFVQSDLTLEVGKTAVINFVLKVGTAAETVTVVGSTALDIGKADRGEVVENTRVTELPLNGRDPQMLSILNAGVIWTGSAQWQRPFDSTQTNLNINGGGAGNNELLLDGVTNDSGNGNSVVGYIPPVDAVQEFKIITNPYDAQFGRAQGGVQDITLKSGTNQLHGDVYEFARRSWLDADTWQNDWLNSRNPHSATKGQHKLDQYGAELDGPIFIPKLYDGRDKSFFLLQFENWDEKVPNTMVTSVPDPSWLTGNFSNLTYWDGSKYSPITLYDPTTLHADSSGNMVRDPFPGNIIPAGRINPVAQKLLSYYPKPNITPASGTNPFSNNYTTPNPTTDVYRNVLGKWDQNLGAKDRFSIRYGYWERWEERSDNGMPGEAKSGAEPFGQRGNTFTTDWVHTFSPSLLFDLRGSAIVRYNGWHNGPQDFNVGALGWGSSGLGSHMPYMKISEFAYLGNQGANIDVENTAAILPSVTWIKGNHTIHMGVDLRALQKAIKSTQSGPSFWIDRQWTQSNYISSQWTQDSGSSVASMLLGYASSGSSTILPQAYWTQHYYAPFIQDDWKITRKLTLNLGLRYDLNGPVVERHNRVNYAFDTAITNPIDSVINHSLIPGGGSVKGAVRFAGVNGNPRSYYELVKTNIQPRIGFAYAVTDRIVIRGGIGEMFKNPIPGGNQYGWSSTTNFNSSYDGGKTVASTLSNPFPYIVQPTGNTTGAYTALGQGPWFINPHYKTPGIWQYSLGLQQQLSQADTIEISYVGSRGFRQDSSDNINRWDSSYKAKCNVEMGGNRHLCDDANPGYTQNPFQGISAFQGSSYYSASTIQVGNFTRPFSAFGDIIEYQLNDGKTWYNSLQVTGIHRWKKDLTMHGTWTWSKSMASGGYSDQTYRIKARWLDSNDFTHRVTLSGVYNLPFGRGRQFLGRLNRLADIPIGGWELGSLYVYQTGGPWQQNSSNPWSVGDGLEYKHNARLDRTVDPSTGYIRGVRGCVANTDSETGAHTMYSNNYTKSNSCSDPDFVVRPSYGAVQSVTYSGIRLPNYHQFDTNLSKNFILTEQLKMQFRLEAFNVLNHPLWQVSYTSTANDPNFGTIQRGPSGQSNLPRQVQVAVKLMW